MCFSGQDGLNCFNELGGLGCFSVIGGLVRILFGRAITALVGLRVCAGPSEPMLLDYVINTKIMNKLGRLNIPNARYQGTMASVF